MSFIIRPYKSGEEEYVAQSHLAFYGGDFKWSTEFTDYAMGIPRKFASVPHGEDEELWIAEMGGAPVGSIMLCRTETEGTGQLRVLLVDKAARELGIGSALLDTAIERAKKTGYKKLVIYTSTSMTDAIRKYERLGFREIERSANTSWSTEGETLYEVYLLLELN